MHARHEAISVDRLVDVVVRSGLQELGLTEEQQEKLNKAFGEMRQKMRAAIQERDYQALRKLRGE